MCEMMVLEFQSSSRSLVRSCLSHSHLSVASDRLWPSAHGSQGF